MENNLLNNIIVESLPIEGVLVGENLLNYDNFKNFMKDKINSIENNEKDKDQIIKILGNIIHELSKKRPKVGTAYKKWQIIQQKIFNYTKPIQIMFISNVSLGNKNYQYYETSTNWENNDLYLSATGYLGKMETSMSKIFIEDIQEQLSDHLAKFIEDVDTKNISYGDISYIFTNYKKLSNFTRGYANKAVRSSDQTYRNYIYGRENKNWIGNVVDAFVNHLGHLHAQLFGVNIENSNNQKQLFAQTVFQEEKDNIINLLIESGNVTAFYTGGDLILKYGNILYNVQVKSSVNKTSSIGQKLSYSEFLETAKQLLNLIENSNNNDEEYQKLYNQLVTSGWEAQTSKTIDKGVKQNLKN